MAALRRPPTEPSAREPVVVQITARQALPLRAYLADLWSHRRLLRVLAVRELKGEHEFNVIGFAWWLLDPLTFAFVYFIVVDVIFNRGGPDYPLFVLIALLPYKWLVSSITGAMSTVRGNGNLIANVFFPRALLPLVELATGLAHFLVGLCIVPVFMLVFGVGPSRHLLWLPLIVVVQAILILAIAYPAAVWGLSYRNLPRLTTNLLRLWFYLSPGIWSLEMIADSPEYVRLVRLNPLTGIFVSYRGAILTHEAPPVDLLYSAGIGIVGLLLGAWYFIRREPTFGKVIQ